MWFALPFLSFSDLLADTIFNAQSMMATSNKQTPKQEKGLFGSQSNSPIAYSISPLTSARESLPSRSINSIIFKHSSLIFLIFKSIIGDLK